MIKCSTLLLTSLLILVAPLTANDESPKSASSTATCQCEHPAKVPSAQQKKGHLLRGHVEAIFSERSSLLVKHEAIPDVMAAMTMMFKVAPADLEVVSVGDPITALMYRDPHGKWSLTEILVSADH